MSRLIFGQKNLAEISFTVVITPGCARPCRVWKTARRWVVGTRGLGEFVEMSQIICVSEVGTGRYVNLPVAYSGDDKSDVSRRGWSKAICRRMISEGDDRIDWKARQRVGRYVLFTGHMSDIAGKLRNKIQMSSFARWIYIRLRTQRERKRTMIDINHKFVTLEWMPKVFHCKVHSQKFTAKCAVTLFSRF